MTTDTHGAQRALRTRSASTPPTVWLATGLMITGASIQLIGMFHALSLVDAVREERVCGSPFASVTDRLIGALTR